MIPDDPIIAVIGAGAVGGYYGARLIEHGHRVHLFTSSDCSHIKKSGLRIRSRDGDFVLEPGRVNVHDDPREMPKADLVIVTLKTTANHRLNELIEPVLKPDSVILTLQNGLGNEEILGELFGAYRVVGGMAFVCINRTGPGEISHTDHGLIRVGELRGGPSPRVHKIAELLSGSKVPCEVLDDLIYGRWDKLIWNIPFNGLGAALDLTTDRIIESNTGLRLVRRLMDDVIAACRPLNLQFDLHVSEEKIRHTQTMGQYKTSMQIDRQMGRPLEIEAIIGKPLELARSKGVSTPYISMLYDLVRLVDVPSKSASF
jgi:2-dehydropantoate 2-reductase